MFTYNCILCFNLLSIEIKIRATQSEVYPLAYKLDPVTMTFDLENQ